LLVSGSSGCGKSTLARCLTGLIPHLYHGELLGHVWLNGQRTDQTELWKLVGMAGLVFQNPAAQMLAPTVEEEIVFGLENLGLKRRAISERLEEALERFGLEELRLRSPQTLSGGEQQKLALASMTARRPSLLILDEPLSMLDSTAAFDFLAQLDRTKEAGDSIILCEHRLEFVQCCLSVTEMKLGDKEAQAEPEPLSPSWPFAVGMDFQLQVDNLSVWRAGREVLSGLDFSARGGQVLAIVGRNGVGKTTLLRALAGLESYRGEISVDAAGKSESLELGMVFQNPDLQLFNASVRAEILYGLANPDMAYYAWLLQAAGLREYEFTPPLLLSEGEKRRLALATVLMRQPKHGILLDEPSLGQDSNHKRDLMRLLKAYAEAGFLIILATHDLELARMADQLFLLGPDGFLAQGPSVEILGNHAAWEQLGLRLPAWIEVAG
jgi:energy-coupling factor transporter ATP-binding protein EcfA2